MAGGTYGGGTGVALDPYLLEDYEDLVAFSTLTRTDRNVHGKLMNDVDMSDKTWTSIGNGSSSSSVWLGNFYGNGKTIRNYTGVSTFINYTTGKVFDLTLDNFNITNNSDYAGIMLRGGYPVNCHITNSLIVSSARYVGILMGGSGHKASQCSVKNSKINATSSGNVNCGGIVGWGEAEYCYTENVEVHASNGSQVGGICGCWSGLSDSIIAVNCYSKGGFVLGAYSVGGIVGAGGAKNCYTTTTVYGNSQTGGISGGSASNSSVKAPVEGCVAMNNRIVRRGLTNNNTSFYDISHPTSQSVITNCIARSDMPFGSEAI